MFGVKRTEAVSSDAPTRSAIFMRQTLPDRSVVSTRSSIAGVSQHTYGFSLVELVVVIAIIALLIALLLPALQRAKRQVKVLTCLSNLKQLGTGIMTYVSDDQSGEYPYPSSVNGNWIHYPGQTVDNLEALAAAAGYSKGDDSIWYCPLYHCGPGLPWFVETSPLYPDIYCKIFGVNSGGS